MLILDSKNYIPENYFHGETDLDASFGFSKQLFLSLLVNFFSSFYRALNALLLVVSTN
jgi:hypothetical protein